MVGEVIGLSLLGLTHNYIITSADVIGVLGWQLNATTLAYFILAGLCLTIKYVTRPTADDGTAGDH